MNENYEREYHKTLHGHLYTNPEYYELRAKLAYLNYFKNVKNLKNKKVLEFGCGLGQNIYWLSKLGVNAKGYDISKFALNFCKEKGLNVTNRIEKEKFDIVFSRHVLEHLRNPFEELVKMRELLRNKGILILILPCEKNERVSSKPDIHRHLYSWNFRAINNLLDEAGFRVVENKTLRFAMGYNKLKFTSRISLKLYDILTKLVGFARGARELKIIVVKK